MALLSVSFTSARVGFCKSKYFVISTLPWKEASLSGVCPYLFFNCKSAPAATKSSRTFIDFSSEKVPKAAWWAAVVLKVLSLSLTLGLLGRPRSRVCFPGIPAREIPGKSQIFFSRFPGNFFGNFPGNSGNFLAVFTQEIWRISINVHQSWPIFLH